MITPNIWQFSAKSMLSWAAAYSIWEPISYLLIPTLVSAKTAKEYYNPKKFSFTTVVTGDFLYSTMLFLVAQNVIGRLFSSSVGNGFDWLLRFLTFTGVQWLGDASFYGLVKSLPEKYNLAYLDFFKRYGSEIGINAPIGNTLYGIVWFTLTQLMATYVPDWLQLFFIVSFLFLMVIVAHK